MRPTGRPGPRAGHQVDLPASPPAPVPSLSYSWTRGRVPPTFPVRPSDGALSPSARHFTGAAAVRPSNPAAGLAPPPLTSGGTDAWGGQTHPTPPTHPQPRRGLGLWSCAHACSLALPPGLGSTKRPQTRASFSEEQTCVLHPECRSPGLEAQRNRGRVQATSGGFGSPGPPLPAPTSPALGGLLAGTNGVSDGRQAQGPLRRRQTCAFTWAGIQLAGKPRARVGAGSWGRGEGRHTQPPVQPSQGLCSARGCSRGITSIPGGPNLPEDLTPHPREQSTKPGDRPKPRGMGPLMPVLQPNPGRQPFQRKA